MGFFRRLGKGILGAGTSFLLSGGNPLAAAAGGVAGFAGGGKKKRRGGMLSPSPLESDLRTRLLGQLDQRDPRASPFFQSGLQSLRELARSEQAQRAARGFEFGEGNIASVSRQQRLLSSLLANTRQNLLSEQAAAQSTLLGLAGLDVQRQQANQQARSARRTALGGIIGTGLEVFGEDISGNIKQAGGKISGLLGRIR